MGCHKGSSQWVEPGISLGLKLECKRAGLQDGWVSWPGVKCVGIRSEPDKPLCMMGSVIVFSCVFGQKDLSPRI